VPTAAGFLYLSVGVDAFIQRVVGWAMAIHLRKELVMSALEVALQQRSPGSDVDPLGVDGKSGAGALRALQLWWHRREDDTLRDEVSTERLDLSV
jgi:transposase InsO family protein